jgi:hypothetical protein
VDQHFDRKDRLGRLIIAAFEKGKKNELAYGVDENTAMVVNNETKVIEIVGVGGVTLVDFSKAVKDLESKRTAIKDIIISYIKQGDSFNIATKEFKFNPKKVDTVGCEYYKVTGPILTTEAMSANGYWKQFIAYDLVDNAAVTAVKSYLCEDEGVGFELTFRKTVESNGYWTYLNGGTKDYYSMLKVALDIKPVRIDGKHD